MVCFPVHSSNTGQKNRIKRLIIEGMKFPLGNNKATTAIMPFFKSYKPKCHILTLKYTIICTDVIIQNYGFGLTIH